MFTRRPQVAGTFYATPKQVLQEQIEKCFLHSLGPGKLPSANPEGEKKIIGLVSPHAGYIYSGPVAAHGFYRLAQEASPELVVAVGPNHTGLGAPVAVDTNDSWETPLGLVKVNSEVANTIVNQSDTATSDRLAHQSEHSLEVQLPFIQYLYQDKFSFVPICMLDQRLATSLELGKAIAQAVGGKEAIIIASTDFTHYETQEQAKNKDKQAIDAILSLEPEKLAAVVEHLAISMCGAGPVIAMLAAAKRLGAIQAELLSYHTSGDITGDYLAVVGYGSVEVIK